MKKDLSKQATEEAKFKVHSKGYNGSQLSLNSFELLKIGYSVVKMVLILSKIHPSHVVAT